MAGQFLFVIPGVGDPLSVGRDARPTVRALPVGERFDVQRLQIDGIDFGIPPGVLRLRLADSTQIDRFPVARPLGIAVIVIARRDLPRRPAELSVDDVDLGISFGQWPSTIRPPGEAIDKHGRRRPFRPLGTIGGLDGQDRLVIRDKGRINELLSVRRPDEISRNPFDMGERSDVARVEPQDMDLE